MPPPSRRALLELVGTGTAALLAGCQTDSSTNALPEGSTPTESARETSTATASTIESETETTTPGEADCAAVSRPEMAWPVPRRSPARDGFLAAPAGLEESPDFAWEAEPSVPEGSSASPTYGQPVIARGELFLTNYLERGPQRPKYGQVHALDAGSGDRRWASDRLRSPSHPVVWGDLVVVVAEDESFDAKVVAFDRAEGTRQWVRRFDARHSGFVSADDHLYLAMEEATDRGSIRTLAEDGSTVWRREGAFVDHVNAGPTVGSDTVYVATREGRLYALARDDGTTDWSHQFEQPTERRPYVTDLVATTCNSLTVVEGAIKALDDGGTLVWEDGGDYGQLATDGEMVYAATNLGGGDREFRAMDVTTGEVRWTVGGSVGILGSPVVVGDAVYARLEESIVALDREDGREWWRTDRPLGDLSVANGMLYGSTRNSLVALR